MLLCRGVPACFIRHFKVARVSDKTGEKRAKNKCMAIYNLKINRAKL